MATHGKTAVLLRSSETTEIPRFIAPDPDHTYYVVSLRGAGAPYWELIRDMPHACQEPQADVREVSVPSYGQVEQRPWTNDLPLGDYSLNAALGQPDGVEALLFPFGRGRSELWMFIHESEERRRLAEALGISCRRLTVSRKRSSCDWLTLRFLSPEQVQAYYPADQRLRPWYYAALGMAPDASGLFEKLTIAPDVLPVDGVVSGPRLRSAFSQPLNLKKHWRFSLRSDVTFYDVSDPLYCVPNAWRGTFESRLTDGLQHMGFCVRMLPLTEPVLANWIGWGEIPVPGAPQADPGGAV